MNKRTRLLLTAFMMLSIFTTVQANNTLTLYDDGESSTSAPINNAYLDEVGTRTQVIYPAQDITAMYGEVFNSMTFYTYDPISVDGGVIEVSVGETSQTQFSGAGSYVVGLTHVATISMTSGATEIEIVFDTPIRYHGGNFVIETLVTEATDFCYVTFMGSRPQIYTAMTRNEVERFLPKTTFNYGITADYNAKVMPDELTFNTIRAERTDIMSITLINNGLMEFAPTFSVEAPFIVNMPDTILPAGASMEVPVTFAPQAEGIYTATLSIDCGEAGIVEATLHGTAIAAAEDLLVGDETDYASFVPIYGNDIDIVDTRSQMIYNANLLTDMAGGDIVALQFHVKDKVKMEDVIGLDKGHVPYYLQTFLYALAEMENTEATLPIQPVLFFPIKAASPDYDPSLKIDGEVVDDFGSQHAEAFREGLQNILADIFNPDKPFTCTTDAKACEYCKLGQICGKRL